MNFRTNTVTQKKPDGTIFPEDHLSLGENLFAGLQHVIAMFGATVLGPLLMGFDPNVAILWSGVATILFYILLKGRVPSYLGSSFSFIGAVIAATGYTGSGPNPNIGVALSGIVAAGMLYATIGLVIMLLGPKLIEWLMPQVVTGIIVTIIGLNLASVGVSQISKNSFHQLMGLLTIFIFALCAVILRGIWRRFSILAGLIISTVVYAVMSNGGGIGYFGVIPSDPISLETFRAARWVGLPSWTTPVFDWRAISLIAPVAVVLVAENLGHLKAIGNWLSREEEFSAKIGVSFFADGLATVISGSLGGTGVTTYAENMGVMRITRNFSSLTFVFAGLIAIALSFSPAFGALLRAIPLPVIGGLSFVVFGIITASGLGILSNIDRHELSKPKNLITIGTAVIMGSGDLKLTIGPVVFGGISTATFFAILLYHLLSLVEREDDPSSE